MCATDYNKITRYNEVCFFITLEIHPSVSPLGCMQSNVLSHDNPNNHLSPLTHPKYQIQELYDQESQHTLYPREEHCQAITIFSMFCAEQSSITATQTSVKSTAD